MLLAFDIGNTNMVVGCFEKQTLKEVVRLQTDPNRSVDEYAGLLIPLLERRLGMSPTIERAVISSVVPPLTTDIADLIQSEFQVEPLQVGPGVRTGIAIRAADPSAVGADRVVNALAAKTLFGSPVIVVDFGTATSFDVVDKNGDYLGGAIAPGLKVSLEALVARTAKLPKIELSWPERVVGNSTITAMQSGAVVGYTCLVDGLIDSLGKEVGGVERVVATGGLGADFVRYCEGVDEYVPHLTLEGLRLIAELNE